MKFVRATGKGVRDNLFLVAAAFLVLGIVLGVRVFAAPAPLAQDGGQSAAVDTLQLQ